MTQGCLPDTARRWTRGDLVVTTDRDDITVDAVYALLETAWWTKTMTRERLERALRGSIVFAVYDRDRLVGLSRVVTDLATFGYLTDVIVAPSERGRGIGKLMIECILDHPELQGMRRLTLLTTDAQDLYRHYGFREGPTNSTYMERVGNPEGASD
jgi:N-acetylglutamate synthase-like GNAT family acetyltransferase